jgi:hypothetical protein
MNHYELRIDGHLDEHWSAWFGGLTVHREDDGTTILRGAVTDQAALHSLLAKVRDLGITLISVNPVDGRFAGDGSRGRLRPSDHGTRASSVAST